jgi:hypothetical protein
MQRINYASQSELLTEFDALVDREGDRDRRCSNDLETNSPSVRVTVYKKWVSGGLEFSAAPRSNGIPSKQPVQHDGF